MEERSPRQTKIAELAQRSVRVHAKRYFEDPAGEERRFACVKRNLHAIRQRLRDLQSWQKSSYLDEACEVLDGGLAWAGSLEVTEQRWLGWLLASISAAWTWRRLCKRYSPSVIETLFGENPEAAVWGEQPLIDTPPPRLALQ